MSHSPKTAAVVLAGCGHLDGAEVREAVLALLALDRAGVRVQCFAPDINQHRVSNHLTGKPTSETRNVLVEAARIARGKIEPLAALDAAHFDMLVCPGGFGVANNLSDLATAGADAVGLPDFQRVVEAFRAANKPICVICIAPAVLVAMLGEGEVTVGDDEGTAGLIYTLGGRHVTLPVTGCHVDRVHRIVSTPAYMYGNATLGDVSTGIEAAVAATVALT